MDAFGPGFDTKSEAWRIARALNICLAKIVGKFAAYPRVDVPTFRRIYGAIGSGLVKARHQSPIEDFCQELRGVLACPLAELLRPSGADELDTRLTAIAQVVRERAGLEDDLFRELLTGILSWDTTDKEVILGALTDVIRG